MVCIRRIFWNIFSQCLNDSKCNIVPSSNIQETCKELIQCLVCWVNYKDCMLRHCKKCPPKENLKKFLNEKFEECDPEDKISYSSLASRQT